MPLRPVFERSLSGVSDDLLRMTSMVDQAIDASVQSLIDRNVDLAQKVSSDDRKINELRYAIEEHCYLLIATQQPNTKDLRILVGAVNLATNLERIGDHAAGISRLVMRMAEQPLIKPLVDIPQMAEIGREMVRNAVDAFLSANAELAEQVALQDNKVDQLHKQVYTDLVEIMRRDRTSIQRATYLLWISHNLERIGDRALNIAERAIYIATGELKELE